MNKTAARRPLWCIVFLGACCTVVIGGRAALAETGTGAKAVQDAAGKAGMNAYRDERTGAWVRDLTPAASRAQGTYQTHPMWTQGMEYLLFSAEKAGKMTPHVLQMKTGEIRELVEGGVGSCVLEPKRGRVYYEKKRTIYAIDIEPAFRREGGPHAGGPPTVATLPAEAIRVEGGLSLDAKADLLYAGVVLEEKTKWAILALDVASLNGTDGHWQTVTQLDFRVGHVQANPLVPRIIMFCHETGGDAPQRTWVVNADGTDLGPFYKETYNEWVTHEVWWGGDRAVFTIWPYDEEHKRKPHGVVSVNLATGKPTVHAQFPAWHTHGSPDGKWLVADDFERNIWLIKTETGERRLLTQGHLGKGFDTHPHPSFTPDSKAVIFTSSRNGSERVFMVEIPAWDSLPLP